jgi:hypothetical protein
VGKRMKALLGQVLIVAGVMILAAVLFKLAIDFRIVYLRTDQGSIILLGAIGAGLLIGAPSS